MTKQFDVQINEKDYEICERYGFDFEKNFEEMIKDVAKELREVERRK